MPSTNGQCPGRAILYARVSTDEQARSGHSLAQQLEALREYATREGYEVLEEVQDPGQSGASLERPGMDRVRDLVAAAVSLWCWPRTAIGSLESRPTFSIWGRSSPSTGRNSGLLTTAATEVPKGN
jgi:hypothetical protein